MSSCRTALLLCGLHVILICSVAQQLSTTDSFPQSSNSPDSNVHRQPASFVPTASAGRCWAPGSTPWYNVTLMGMIEANEAAESYAKTPNLLFTGYWTNAMNRNSTEDALVRTRAMRTALAAHNLHHPYLPGKLVGNINSADQVPCGQGTRTTRTIDGSCNYQDDPLAGAAGTRFGRNVPLAATQPDMANLLHPNPLLVSSKLLQRQSRTDYPRVPFLNMWAAAWLQFTVNDWLVDAPSDNSRPISVPMPSQHSLAGVASTMVVGSTSPDPTRTAEETAAHLPPTAINTATHWWDASQIYGSDVATSMRLREGVGGRMKLTPEGLLPLSSGGFGDAGVNQSWWLGLELLHTLFVKEHNAIAAKLAATFPTLTDQQLYDKARMINAAVIAKIHTLETIPSISPNNHLAAAQHLNWHGVVSLLSPDEAELLTSLAGTVYKDHKDTIFGLRGGSRIDWGVKFSMTEELLSVSRTHTLVPESFTVRGADGSSKEHIWTGDTTLAGARAVMEKHSLVDLAATFGTTPPGASSLHNYPMFMTNISLPNNLGALDLAAVDVIRDRERGVPRYNTFRRMLRLKPLPSIDDITTDPAARAALRSVYGDDIELVDLTPGVLAESHRPDCFGIGETQFQVAMLMASRRLAADRFFTSDYSAASYTQVGLDWIEAANFRKVLLRNIPELRAAGVQIPPSAFNPWTLPTQAGN